MLAPDASKLADDCWRVQVTNARLEGCTATEVTATSRKRPDASCRHPDREQHRIRDGRAPRAYSEVAHQASKSCSLRWTNAHAPGAGGVSPPWFTVTQLQRRGAIVRGTSDPYTGERQRSYGTTSTAGSRPPLLRRNANVCRRNCDFCDARTHMHQERGRQPPVVHGTAPARECDFCHGRTRVHQERGASAPRGSRNRTGKGVRLLRCPNACAPGAGGVSPPWFTEPHRQGSATFAMDERVCTRSGGRQPPVARGNRTGKGVRLLRCTNACCTPGGPQLLWLAKPHVWQGELRLLRRTNAHAQERGASAPRGSRQRTCKGVRVTVSAIADRASADPDAVAVLHP
jgi:hypothetical protein